MPDASPIPLTAASLIGYLRDRDVRLRIEGERLRVNAPRGVMTPELAAALRERKVEILDYLRAAPPAPEASPPLVAISRNRRLPLSFAQLRLWFLDRLEPGNAFYNVPLVLRLEGRLNLGSLAQALNRIVARHEALRTSFPESEDGKPTQVIAPSAPVPLPRVDLEQLSPRRCQAETDRQILREVRRPFDLARGSVLRTLLLRRGRRDHVLVLTIPPHRDRRLVGATVPGRAGPALSRRALPRDPAAPRAADPVRGLFFLAAPMAAR